jgi:spore germination protein KA
MNKTQNDSNILQTIKDMFSCDEGISFRSFCCQNDPQIQFCAVFVSGMTDKNSIQKQIIKPIMEAKLDESYDINKLLNTIAQEIISAANVKQSSTLEMIVQSLLTGSTLLFVNEFDRAILIDTANWDKRAITEPEAEKVVMGPREGFTEYIGTNIVLVRRKLKTANLKFKYREIGTQTKTKICICYLEDVAEPKLVREVEARIGKIDLDSVLDVGYIKEMIKDTPFSPFKTIGYTERPDVIAGKILEGRIAVICDGSPIAITMPFLFIEYFNVNEDYYDNFIYATFNRIVRWVSFLLASSVPAIYVALITFHQEMIPTQLLLSISGSRQNVPFPTVVEALLMLFVFEILRESSIRIPSGVGQTVSIVGALVIGQAAVEAKLVSSPMVIVSAITGITSFVIPKMQSELLIIRFIFLLSASAIGLYGYLFCVIGMFIHLASLRSFGFPYMTHIASFDPQDVKDGILRAPWKMMKTRPKLVAQKNRQRTVGEEKAGDEDSVH